MPARAAVAGDDQPGDCHHGDGGETVLILVLALFGGTNYALFDAAANLRVSLRELIEIKLKMEKGQ